MTVRWSTLATAARLGVHLLLLVALGLGFVWPLVDPLAAERDPGHAHLVLGGTAAVRAAALAAHVHAGAAWHDHAPSMEPLAASPSDETQARVIVVGSRDGAAAGSLGLAAKTVLPPLLLTLACLLLVSTATPQLPPQRRPLTLRRLDPPPRPCPV